MTNRPPVDSDQARRAAQWTARARALLVAGLLGAHVAGLAAIGVATVAAGRPGLVSAALGFAVVVLFSTIGQLVMVRLAAAHPRVMMLGALASYLMRCSVLVVAVAVFWNTPALVEKLHPLAFAAAAIATVVGWLAAEVVRFSRMRIPAFDVALPGESTDEQRPTDTGAARVVDRGEAWA